MALLQRHQDHTIIHADGRTVGEGKIISSRRQPDIVHDQPAFVVRNDFTDLVLDVLENPFRGLDAGSGGRADVKLDLSAVDDGKEIAADRWEQHDAKPAHHEHAGWNDRAVPEQFGKRARIGMAHCLKAALEGGVEAREYASRAALSGAVMFALQEQADDDGGQRPRRP